MFLICVKIMRGLARLHSRLRRVGAEAGNERVHRIAFRLATEVFQLHTFFFSRAAALLSRRDRLLGFETIASKADQLAAQVHGASLGICRLSRLFARGPQ